MIILPTKNRPLNLKRFIRAYKETESTLPIWVIFDAADAYRYNDVETPDHWKRVSAPAGTSLGGIFDLIFKKYPNEDYYAMVADDVVPETAEWDIIMAAHCQPDKIVWARDDLQNEKLPVHPFIGGDLVRQLGWWAAPGLKHWFVDNVWKNIADSLQCGVYLDEVKLTHLHYTNGRAQMDRTYREQPDHGVDERTYIKFMKDKFPDIIKSVEVSPL
jgi:hypothetical protein